MEARITTAKATKGSVAPELAAQLPQNFRAPKLESTVAAIEADVTAIKANVVAAADPKKAAVDKLTGTLLSLLDRKKPIV